MSEVALSSAMRANLNALQGTARLMGETQNRLATGLKVSSALDNPSSFFTAQGLKNRASDLGSLLDQQSLAVKTLQAADEGIKSIQKLAGNIKATLNTALTTPVKETTLDLDVTSGDFASTNGELTITVGDNDAVTLDLTADGMGATEIAALINGDTDLGDLGVSATVVDDTLTITAANGEAVTVAGDDASTVFAGGQTLTSSNGTSRASAVSDYNDLLTQITQLASDASFNGVNLLQADNNLTVAFNEDQSSSLTVESADMSSTGLGLTSQTLDDLSTDDGVKAAIANVDAALTKLRQQSATFGANLSVVQTRQDFTKNIQGVLTDGAGDLTLADTNFEAANLLALQTRQSLAQSSLSMANQAEQSVLSLFR